MIILAILTGSALFIFLWIIINEDIDVKKEMLNEQKRAENEAWVNQLIENIKDNEDELAY